MKEIQLTQGQVALVDDEDYEFLNQHKWCTLKNGKTFYTVRGSIVKNKQSTIYMHHKIVGRPPAGFETDHRNGSGLDNQRRNLRFITHRQNGQNRKNQESSSKYPGVGWNKRNKKWQVHIRINGIKKYLGLFLSELEAFKAYEQAVNAMGETII